ncbi:MAG: protein translocase subunit SecD [Rhizobiales bacterium]|nr:protein translocase subunit SecD [Hyphomicrobiales bacterium]
MIHFSVWKTTLVLLTVIVGVALALPNLFSEKALQSLPSWLPHDRMVLGLDLQGGSHLLVQVEREGLVKERLQILRDDVRTALRGQNAEGTGVERIGYTGLGLVGNNVQFRLRDPADAEKAREALSSVVQPSLSDVFGGGTVAEVEMSDENGLFRLSLTENGIDQRLASAVQQSIEVVRRRIDELGTTEPSIQRQGADRILVQVPGFDDPERLKDLLSQTAKLSFRFVDQSMSALDAEASRPPIGAQVLEAHGVEDRAAGVKYLVEDRVIVSGEDLVDAQPGFTQQTNEPVVTFRFNNAGARKFGRATQDNVGRPFAIVLDNKVVSAPRIQEPILTGSGQITGSFTVQSANEFAILLRAGALPAELTVIEERTVGPGLGQDSIDAGFLAAVVGSIAVIGFMILVYGKFGLIADIALVVNIAMIIGALSLLGATLTLPGIAGIVLTVGMAVDANVLIFERVREEIRAGRTPLQAIDAGYSRALGTILDANITTFIAAAILFYLGSGPVKGFAVTLVIGIFATVFCGFTFSRYMVAQWVLRKRPKTLSLRWILDMVPDGTTIKFMRLRRFSFPISAILVAGSLALFGVNGLNLGIDFKGGTIVEIKTTDGPADIGAIRGKLGALGLGDIEVQEFGSPDDILIRVQQQEGGDQAQQEAVRKVRTALGEANIDYRRIEVVGPRVSGELTQAGTIAVLVALIAVLIYIWFRFEWHFAVGAVIATVHDVVITIGLFALLQLDFNLSTIAAVLTIVGYSLNDTVVVYDRIRENLRKYKRMSIASVLDLSINETLSRTALTSVTTLIALLALYFLGGDVIQSFTFAMIWGVIIGTCSSVFIAAPLLIMLNLRPSHIKDEKADQEDNEPAAI